MVEMMSYTTETPTRKRKREGPQDLNKATVCFTNAAFSSTPKRLVGKRRIHSQLEGNFVQGSKNSYGCMEVKSIAELVKQHEKSDKTIEQAAGVNPYEVQRKPPKKKKKREIEDACFENPALNLNLPEKQFNPYEVKRTIDNRQEQHHNCFTNAGLNIKTKESVLSVRNPFEIERAGFDDVCTKRTPNGIENLALEDGTQPTGIKIGIPFTPTVGCRIDFNNVSLTQLTSNKLLLAEKLVFSPVSKKSLDAISKESSTVSIGKELDRYQLELENSINEAKLRRNDVNNEQSVCEREERFFEYQQKTGQRISLTNKLSNIPEDDEFEIQESEMNINISAVPMPDTPTIENQLEESIENNNNAGFDFDEDDEDFDFKAPTRFVRAYRRDAVPLSKLEHTKDLRTSKETSPSESLVEHKKSSNIKDLLRKSIRKLVPHHKHKAEEIVDQAKDDPTTQSNIASNIFSSIRHSLRCKPKPINSSVETKAGTSAADISIVDTSERTMKLKSCAPENEYMRIEELTTEKKHLLRNGSLRQSTREVRQQLMRKIFQHKQEEYRFNK